MKKLVVFLFVIVPAIAFSQIKPSIPTADAALKAGKLDEAKAIIDATVGNQEFMVDKKGQPSKNAVKKVNQSTSFSSTSPKHLTRSHIVFFYKS